MKRKADLCELKAGLVYMSSKTAEVRETLSQQNKN